jgi:AAA domain, putative AbiEii toxin, Type IV TA system
MATLKSVSVANYRSFLDPTELELRPLTLVYGRNSAGKSALVRVLPLLGDSVARGAAAPLDLSGDVSRDSTFLDLKWKGAREAEADPLLRIGLCWDAPARIGRVEFGLDLSRERNVTLIREIEAFDAKDERLLHATYAPSSHEARDVDLHYDLVHGDQPERRLKLTFEGLVPASCADAPWIDALREQMLELRGTIQWLGTLHKHAGRLIPEQGTRPTHMESNGEEAAAILRTSPEIREEVTRFYKEHFNRSLVIAEVPPDYYRLLLRPDLTMDVDLVDAGEGMLQMFPLLVAAAMARRHANGGPRILAIEEPESQLHPDAQREFAAHLCEIAKSPEPPCIVLETHSYALLLSVQLAIAKGDLPRERVVAYWLEMVDGHRSHSERVTFDAQGRPEGNWPGYIFADHRDLARELLREQLKSRPRDGA